MYEQILSDVKNKEWSPIYFLYGEEAFFIDSITKVLENGVLNEAEKSFNQVTLYGKDVKARDILDQCVQFPMMATHRVILVKEAQNVKDIKDLEKYFANPAPSTILVFGYKSAKVTKTTKWYKALKKTATIFESKKLYDNQVAPYIQNAIKASGRTIGPKAAGLLAEYLGSDLSKVHNEIDKLNVIIPKGAEISAENVQEQVGISKEYNVFELQTAIATKDFQKTFRITNYFMENPGNHPMVMIIPSLFRYFTKVWIIQQNSRMPDKELAKVAGIYNTYFLRDYKTAARNFPENKVLHIFEILKEYDLKVKGVNNRSNRNNDLLNEMVGQMF